MSTSGSTCTIAGELKPGDGVTQGWGEIVRAKGIMWGFNYINPQLIELMKEFQHKYLNHQNRYTSLPTRTIRRSSACCSPTRTT